MGRTALVVDTFDHFEEDNLYRSFLSGATTRFSLDLLVLSWFCIGVVTIVAAPLLYYESTRSRILVAELYTKPDPG